MPDQSLEERKPYVYVANRAGKWVGAAASDIPPARLREYLGDFVMSGCEVVTTYSREEYEAEMARLKGLARD